MIDLFLGFLMIIICIIIVGLFYAGLFLIIYFIVGFFVQGSLQAAISLMLLFMIFIVGRL